MGEKPIDHPFRHGDQQRVFVGEMAIYTGTGDARRGADFVDAGAVKSVCAEQGDGRVENHLAT